MGNAVRSSMRIIIETSYVWLGASSFEVEPETTLSELCQLFKAKEDHDLEQLVFNRVLYPDDLEIPLLRDVHNSLEQIGVRHGDKLMAIHPNSNKPLPVLKSISNDASRDFESEAKHIALGKVAVAEEKLQKKAFDTREKARQLPAGWARAKGDAKTRKPGVWYYFHEDGTRQWKFPTGDPADEDVNNGPSEDILATMAAKGQTVKEDFSEVAKQVAEAN